MLAFCALIAVVVPQKGQAIDPLDVSAHVQVVRTLTERLQRTDFPKLAGWQLLKRTEPKNLLLLDALDYYVWIDPSGESDHSYSLQGVKLEGTILGEPISPDELVREWEEASQFEDGSWWRTELDRALLALMSAGRSDLVERVIKRDRLYRSPVYEFENRLFGSLITKFYNVSTRLYTSGHDAQARASLLPVLTWILHARPTVSDGSAGSPVVSFEVFDDRAFILAAELRRRLRDKDESVFSFEDLDKLTGQQRIDYLIEHLDNSSPRITTHRGATFGLSFILDYFKAEGEPMIAALRKTIESDHRLTRVASARLEGNPLYIYSVADVARQYVKIIEKGL